MSTWKFWVKFVAMYQNNATLIYDLNKMKCIVESYHPFKTAQFKA